MLNFRGGMWGYNKLTENNRFAVYFLYAFGSTILLTLVLFLADAIPGIPMNMKPNVGYERCWVQTNRLTEFLYVYLPISIISLVNIILFIITAYNIFKHQKQMTSMMTGDSQNQLNMNTDEDR